LNSKIFEDIQEKNLVNQSLIFPFLKYTNSTWYFNLIPLKDSCGYWVDYRKLNDKDRAGIAPDPHFESFGAQLRDGAFQAWQAGLAVSSQETMLDQNVLQAELPLKDNYRFIRKYYRGIWAVYILILRIVTFNNPLKELAAFYVTRKVKRHHIQPGNFHSNYLGYNSSLIEERPLVSVIIPTLNRYSYLADALHDLEKQNYPNFEVILVDQSEPFVPDFYSAFDLNIILVNQKEKALWRARNEAVKLAKGEYLLLFDDDSRVDPNWIFQHLKCIDYFEADISAGVSLSVVGAKVPENYSFFRWADQLDTGNCLLKKEIFTHIGLFDCQFEKQRMGDGEYGLRCYLHGYRSISNPYARRTHLKVASGGLRQMGSWDGFRPKNFFSPRPVPSVLYLYRKYFGNKNALLALFIHVPPSLMPYRFKNSRSMMMLGRFFSILLFPIVLLQVFISWKKATIKLNEGELVEYL